MYIYDIRAPERARDTKDRRIDQSRSVNICGDLRTAKCDPGYNDSGFIIRDPNSPENSARVWAFDEIRDQIKNLWSFEAA